MMANELTALLPCCRYALQYAEEDALRRHSLLALHARLLMQGAEALGAERDLADISWDELCGMQDAARHLLDVVESAKDVHVTHDARKRQVRLKCISGTESTSPSLKDSHPLPTWHHF
jgi:hypothetical protein